MPKIEMEKKYKTLDGAPVRLLCVDRKHDSYPVVGLIRRKEVDVQSSWTIHGSCSASSIYSHNDDLIEDKPRVQRNFWVNVYPEKLCCLHDTKEDADKNRSINRIACIEVKIDCEYGEGLSK